MHPVGVRLVALGCYVMLCYVLSLVNTLLDQLSNNETRARLC